MLEAALATVPAHGWTLRALREGAAAVGLADVAHGLCPRGPVELVDHFVRTRTRLIAPALRAEGVDLAAMGVTARVRTATIARLQLTAPFIRKWPQAAALLAQPQNLPTTLRDLGELVDEIWFLAGDRSVDLNWYSKRMLLAGVYTSTEMFMTTDTSPGFVQTFKFLDRRLKDVVAAGKTVSQASQILSVGSRTAAGVLASRGFRGPSPSKIAAVETELHWHAADLLAPLKPEPQGGRHTKQDIVARSGRGLSAPQAWTVAADDVDIFWDSQIGEGGYGRIFRGEGSGMRVAVKVVAETLGREGVDLIQKETAVWFPLHHPNVLRLWRVCLNADKPFIVMPLMRDDVAGFLRKAPATSMAVRTHFLAGAARGMQYLHELSPPIIHGDLKANNVLVGDDGDARITDFGLALVKASVSATTKRKTGAVRWIAPEKYKRGYKQALAQDVFSFGMTAYQIVSGKVPFAEEVHDDIVKDWIKDGERPDRPDGVPDALWSIIEECWRHEPEQRPAFRDIARRLSMLPQDKPQLSVPGNATAALAALRMHDSGFASSQPEISDAERLVQAFPVWCASKGITAANAQRFDATVKNGSAGSLEMLEWENNKLFALRLKNQGLEGPLTPLIGGFRHLRSLWLDQNKITSLPDSIGNLKELTHLYVLQTRVHLMAMVSRTRCRDLTSNQLSSLPASLGGLSKLQGLFVGINKLTVVTEQIGSLKGLLKLSLNFNQLSTLPASIGSLTKLQAFWVGHNKLTVVPEWTGNLKELTNLCVLRKRPFMKAQCSHRYCRDFEANQISEFPESIGELTKLQELWAGENKLTAVPSSMGNLRELATLYLYGNPVSTDQLKAFITPYK
ncbi:hypothetical protein HK105_204910 [Polyrhizophydium stewartii]|uniref:Protein kinase domain-containing protein n=1 Tax=Polyrhizophydium stewartii TaxID=2732419 RepID=A0ABR4N7M8_9FUNG